MGIDGRIFPVSAIENVPRIREGDLALEEKWYPIQVKQTAKAGRPDIDAFEAMMARKECQKGFFISFDYSSDAMVEISRFSSRPSASSCR